MNAVTTYPVINTVLNDWVRGARSLLGKNIIGLYLSGSLAGGDFIPERSDIDLQAVVSKPLTDAELSSIERLHREIERRCPAWANRIECSYVPLELLSALKPPAQPRPWWGFGTFYSQAPAGNEWIINHYLLSRHGVALEGPEFRELIPPISLRDVRQASANDLFQEWAPKGKDTTWLSDSHNQSYLVLNLCRILHSVIRFEQVSKVVAGRWVKVAYPEWQELIGEAESWCYGRSMDRQPDVVAFLHFAVERVNEAKLPP